MTVRHSADEFENAINYFYTNMHVNVGKYVRNRHVLHSWELDLLSVLFDNDCDGDCNFRSNSFDQSEILCDSEEAKTRQQILKIPDSRQGQVVYIYSQALVRHLKISSRKRLCSDKIFVLKNFKFSLQTQILKIYRYPPSPLAWNSIWEMFVFPTHPLVVLSTASKNVMPSLLVN